MCRIKIYIHTAVKDKYIGDTFIYKYTNLNDRKRKNLVVTIPVECICRLATYGCVHEYVYLSVCACASAYMCVYEYMNIYMSSNAAKIDFAFHIFKIDKICTGVLVWTVYGFI